MRRTYLQIASALIVGALLSTAGEAKAQDTQYLIPDILLLIDTSGSMALTTFRDNGTTGQFVPPKCGTWASPKTVDINATSVEDAGKTYTAPDRWSILVDVLTGKVKNLGCVAQPRIDPIFALEHGLGTTPAGAEVPIDNNYYLPYNRMVSSVTGNTACTPAPSWNGTVRADLVSNALSWPTANGGPVVWREVGDFTGSNPICAFSPQEVDGLIDQNRELARFGLMTFDTMPNFNNAGTITVGTGIIPVTYNASYKGGIQDTWSYFPDWLGSSPQPATGNPVGCLVGGTNPIYETGARNPAAPPWEGRMITFGKTVMSLPEVAAHNDQVQQALLTVRPFGNTPIAGLLTDARHFLLTDNSNIDPYIGGTLDPKVSTTVGQGCRKRRVILFTDGAPSPELRPDCKLDDNSASDGKCPYDQPYQIAEVLKNNNIPVYVIGMTIGNGTQTCSTLVPPSSTICTTLAPCNNTCPSVQCAYGYCINSPAEENLAQCCVIKGIATAGGTTPYFTETKGELAAAFKDIVTLAANENSSRTVPVFAGLSQASNKTLPFPGARFFSAFKPVTGDLLDGELSRRRFSCPSGGGAPVMLDVAANLGDRFDQNVDGASATSTSFRGSRKIYTVVGATASDRIYSERTIRPWYKAATGDGLGNYGVDSSSDVYTKMVAGTASTISSSIDGMAVLRESKTTCEASATGCCFPTPSQAKPTAAQCRDRFLKMQFGLDTGNADIGYLRQSAFGAVVHSTPVVMLPPAEIIRDDSYQKFALDFQARGSVLFAATADGQLHAFDITKTDVSSNNELWSFMPPAVLSMLPQQFPNRFTAAVQYLLDGPMVVRDVAGTAMVAATGQFLTRTPADAKTTTDTRWYSILVGSFGSSGGYYALDMSWPNPNTTASPPTGYNKGPRFLWQLTTDDNGSPLFGDRGGVPAIATLYFAMPGTTDKAEHAVAILPGGLGGVADNSSVPISYSTSAVDTDVTTGVIPKTTTRKYLPTTPVTDDTNRSLGGARSITIVRLDTGEVIRTLRAGTSTTPAATELQAPTGLYTTSRVTSARFAAPIGGQLVSYPAGVGSVADRAYVGDAEGHLWRLDLSNPDPSKWTGSMFFDAYPTSGLGLTGTSTWASAAPIQTPPIVSQDTLGRVTVAFSTGDQVDISADGKAYNIWSLTENIDAYTKVAKSKVNWYLNMANAKNPSDTAARFQPGERVFGPMALFDGTLYFTTYDPTVDATDCTAGYSYVWGVHYLKAGDDPNAVTPGSASAGPSPMWKDAPPAPQTPKRYIQLVKGTIAFGVGISQAPNCITWGTSAATDSFLGFGSAHSTISSMSPGPMQLLVQSGSKMANSDTKLSTYNLKVPQGGSVIDSWASVVE